MKNGQLTKTAMTHVSKVYVIHVTEAQRLLITVDNIKNPERTNRKNTESKKKKSKDGSSEGEDADEANKIIDNTEPHVRPVLHATLFH